MDDDLKLQQLLPITLEVQEGKTYLWCSCGHSKAQPFCDREGCGDLAKAFVADLTEDLCFCVCKQTKNPPFCDGSHAKLLFEYMKKKT